MGSVAVAVPAEASLPYRTTAEEDTDYKDAVQRAANKEFIDWPNEAGVCSLSRPNAQHCMILT